MDPDLVHTRRLRALDFWPGPIDVDRIPGGITNHNYRVRTAGRTYVARIGVDRPLLGIDRRNEVVCQRAAHALGVAPGVAHHEDGVLVSDHIDARTLTPDDVRDPAFIPRLADVLRRLHDGWDRLSGEILYFSPFQTARTYAETARALGAKVPDDLDALLDDARRLSRTISPFVPVLCHNDMLAANVLDDGRRLWLVDWEYAGVGHPLFDLAGVSANCGFGEELEAALLEAYRGRVDPVDLRELRVLKTASSLREALWATLQTVASDLVFDYHAYAAENFRAHREARAGLDVCQG
jgi:thiamine kinase-like enzyme